VILILFSDKACPAVKKEEGQCHEPIAYGRSENDGWPGSEVRVGDKKQKGQRLCGDYNLNERIVFFYVPQDGEIKEAETEEKKSRLPDIEKILYFYREKEPVE
jgi:hypothetical protein